MRERGTENFPRVFWFTAFAAGVRKMRKGNPRQAIGFSDTEAQIHLHAFTDRITNLHPHRKAPPTHIHTLTHGVRIYTTKIHT